VKEAPILMSINLEALAPRAVEPATSTANDPLILNSIASELSRGLTYITVAKIAHDMGQTERSVNAHQTAAEAEAEAQRLTGLLHHPARAFALKQLENYRLVLEDSQHKNFQFPPGLRQPSLN
jgi:hypothetical protein